MQVETGDRVEQRPLGEVDGGPDTSERVRPSKGVESGRRDEEGPDRVRRAQQLLDHEPALGDEPASIRAA